MMKFGLLYNTDYYPDVHGSASKYYDEILAQTVFAEELGYHAVWFGEHYYSGSPSVRLQECTVDRLTHRNFDTTVS